MKNIVYAAIACFCLTGCVSNPADTVALKAAKNAWAVIAPEYKAYVEKDPSFVIPETRAAKLQTAELLTKLLDEATKEVK